MNHRKLPNSINELSTEDKIMPRKPAKTNEINTMDAIDQAINTPVNLQFCEVCEELGISDPQLRERLEAKTGDANVHLMDSIPCEWELHIKSIRIDLDAERSTRKLEAQAETPQLPEATEQPIEQKPKRQRRSSALTHKKETEIKQQRTSSRQTRSGVREAQILSSANTGAKHGAESGTAYLAGYVANRDNVIGTGLTTLIAEDLQEISQGSGFSPEEVLAKLNIPTSSETQQRLMEKISPVLGKAQEAVKQVTATAWGNGVSLDAELMNLENLLSYDE
jgi:hypothetical protein